MSSAVGERRIHRIGRAVHVAHDAAQALLSRQVLENRPVRPMEAVRLACVAWRDLPAPARDRMIDELAKEAWREIDGGKVELADFRARRAVSGPGRFDAMHAFPTGILLAEFEAARAAGLSAKAFLWLKYVDPVLWRILDNVGRPSRFIEGLGPLAHYEEEKRAGKPLVSPSVYRAAADVVETISGKAVD